MNGARALGELWRERPKAKPPGDNQYKRVDRSKKTSEAPTQAELGYDKDRASRTAAWNERRKAYVVRNK